MAVIDTLSAQLAIWVKAKNATNSSQQYKALTTGSAKKSIDETVLGYACEEAISLIADVGRYSPLDEYFFDNIYYKTQSIRMVTALLEEQKSSKRKNIEKILNEVKFSIIKNSSGVVGYQNEADDSWEDFVVD